MVSAHLVPGVAPAEAFFDLVTVAVPNGVGAVGQVLTSVLRDSASSADRRISVCLIVSYVTRLTEADAILTTTVRNCSSAVEVDGTFV